MKYDAVTRCCLLLVGLLWTMTMAAEAANVKVYKQVDQMGGVVFTDTPPIEGTETVEEIEIDTGGAGGGVAKQATKALGVGIGGIQGQEGVAGGTQDVKRAYIVSIDSPKGGTVFGPETLDIAGSISIDPTLHKDDKIQVLVDSQPALPPQSDTTFKLPLLPAGQHSIVVLVMSSAGKVLGTSNTVPIQQVRSTPVPAVSAEP